MTAPGGPSDAPGGVLGQVGAGFAGAKAGMDQVKAGNDQIQGAIASGHLKMNPESAEKAAKVYEDKADRVRDLADDANKLARVGGLGEYPSSKELAAKFEAKAADGASGAVKLLKDLERELLRKADLFRQAAKDYVATDEQNAQDLSRGMNK